jgi:phosphatidylglycerophosphate synthase
MAPPPDISPIERIQENMLARSERRLLTWLCARLPAWVTPDLLTYFGLFGAVLVFGGYVGTNRSSEWLWMSIVGYAIHWFGDSLDGSLARFRKIERPRYGYFLDHSCDGAATTLVVVGIGLTPYIELEAALIALAGYLLLSIHAFLSVRVLGELRLSYLNLGPTELRLILIALTLAMYFVGPTRVVIGQLTPFDLFVGGAGLLMIVMFVVLTAQKARLLSRMEPPRQ